MAAKDLNYFTCTLGQAAAWNEEHPHSFQTVNDLIDEQAERFPNHPAVGFPGLHQRQTYGPWNKWLSTLQIPFRDYFTMLIKL